MAIVTIAVLCLAGYPAHTQGVADPGQPGPCTTSVQTVTIGTTQSITVHYPSETSCGGGLAAPYPGIAFAHGFSMFGFDDGVASNAGNGAHLASWGYVVAIPRLDDDAETRIGQMQDALDYLEQAAAAPGSFLYQQVDPARLAAVGYSLGGATALALAARDARVKAIVALDPVYHQGGMGGEGAALWDPAAEAPNIAVPTAILGAPPSDCNADSDYLDIYPLLGAPHKASFLVVGASHCDFTDPGSPFCGWVCGEASPTRTQLSQKMMTAWLNYYQHLQTGYYTYLYGTQARADIDAGHIVSQVDTAARGLQATGRIAQIELTWQRTDHPIVVGYNVYRKTKGIGYGQTPYARVDTATAFTDTSVTTGQVYTYTVCSHDAAGNEHQCAVKVSASATAPDIPEKPFYLPLVIYQSGSEEGALSRYPLHYPLLSR